MMRRALPLPSRFRPASLPGSAWLRWSGLLFLAVMASIRVAVAAEPPAVPAAVVPYYVAEGGETRGPLSLEVVIAGIGDGRIVPWTLVWKPGLSAWIRAGDLPELGAALAGAAPRPPPPPAQPPPPPADPPAEARYFVAEGDTARGPLSETEVFAAIAAGAIGAETLVWQPGLPEWVRAGSLPALAGRFAPDPPDIPAAERMRQMMVGTWEFVPAPGGSTGMRTRLAFRGDMTAAGEVTVAVPGGEPLVQAVSGAWAVAEATAERFTLLLDFAGGEPGRVRLRVVDADRLANETDGGSARRLVP